MNEPEARKGIELEFSKKYDDEHSLQYAKKHEASFLRRLNNWREQAIARSALKLAGNPAVVLDLPCGTGRFWTLLAEQRGRTILAADNSEAMLRTARQVRKPRLLQRVELFQASAFDLRLADAAVDCVFCMRLLHHLGDPAVRAAMLREFHRVTRDSVCISLWVDGNRQARKRLKQEKAKAERGENQGYQNRFVLSSSLIEGEFRAQDFDIAGYYDLLRSISMWRVYVLKKR